MLTLLVHKSSADIDEVSASIPVVHVVVVCEGERAQVVLMEPAVTADGAVGLLETHAGQRGAPLKQVGAVGGLVDEGGARCTVRGVVAQKGHDSRSVVLVVAWAFTVLVCQGQLTVIITQILIRLPYGLKVFALKFALCWLCRVSDNILVFLYFWL